MSNRLVGIVSEGVAIVFAALIATPYVHLTWPPQVWPFVSQETTPDDLKALHVGDVLQLPSFHWDSTKRYVFVALQSTCPACNASRDFYRRLSSETADVGGIAFGVISFESARTLTPWLRDASIRTSQIVPARGELRTGVRKTPTLIITDGGGRVTDVIVGMIPLEDEAKVLTKVREPRSNLPPFDVSTPGPHPLRSAQDYAALRSAMVLDVRDRGSFRRGHLESALNIPQDELAARAPIELRRDSPVIVDCSRTQPDICFQAYSQLSSTGFKKVYATTYPLPAVLPNIPQH